jgi:hypothetical protein
MVAPAHAPHAPDIPKQFQSAKLKSTKKHRLPPQGLKYLQRFKTSGANLLLEGSEVDTVAIAMLGIGMAFGVRFRIFVLVPVILLDAFVFTAVGIAQGASIWSITLTSIIGATCLQLGYLGGALLKFVISTGRSDGTRSSQAARPLAR